MKWWIAIQFGLPTLVTLAWALWETWPEMRSARDSRRVAIKRNK